MQSFCVYNGVHIQNTNARMATIQTAIAQTRKMLIGKKLQFVLKSSCMDGIMNNKFRDTEVFLRH